MFKLARKGLSDELTMDEFLSLTIYGFVLFPKDIASKKGLTREKMDSLKSSFTQFDKDGSGKISFDEFKTLIQKFGEPFPPFFAFLSKKILLVESLISSSSYPFVFVEFMHSRQGLHRRRDQGHPEAGRH